VLKLFAEGLTYKEIGDKLFISPRTVETHKNNILNKLEMKSVVEMIKYAIKHELINL
jgi:DNA-binding NarL/FixJ family response regulator